MKAELINLNALLQDACVTEAEQGKISDAVEHFKAARSASDEGAEFMMSKVAWVLPLGVAVLGQACQRIDAFAADQRFAKQLPMLQDAVKKCTEKVAGFMRQSTQASSVSSVSRAIAPVRKDLESMLANSTTAFQSSNQAALDSIAEGIEENVSSVKKMVSAMYWDCLGPLLDLVRPSGAAENQAAAKVAELEKLARKPNLLFGAQLKDHDFLSCFKKEDVDNMVNVAQRRTGLIATIVACAKVIAPQSEIVDLASEPVLGLAQHVLAIADAMGGKEGSGGLACCGVSGSRAWRRRLLEKTFGLLEDQRFPPFGVGADQGATPYFAANLTRLAAKYGFALWLAPNADCGERWPSGGPSLEV